MHAVPRRLRTTLSTLAGLGVLLTILAGCGSSGRSQYHFGKDAGYIWNGPVRSVGASWIVPRLVDGRPNGVAGTWIGAQSFRAAGPFIQIGTYERRLGSRHSEYFAFWSDTGQDFSAKLLFPVHASDVIMADLALTPTRHWKLTIIDSTTGIHAAVLTRGKTSKFFDQAEWVQEDPSDDLTGTSVQYPTLTPVHFHSLSINDSATPYSRLSSVWMSAGGENFAPSPLTADSFIVQRATVTRAGGHYLRIARRDVGATLVFTRAVAHWTLNTPRSEVTREARTLSAALVTVAKRFANFRWPTRVRALVRSLVDSVETLRRHAVSTVVAPEYQPATARRLLSRDAAEVLVVDRALRRALRVPERTP